MMMVMMMMMMMVVMMMVMMVVIMMMMLVMILTKIDDVLIIRVSIYDDVNFFVSFYNDNDSFCALLVHLVLSVCLS